MPAAVTSVCRVCCVTSSAATRTACTSSWVRTISLIPDSDAVSGNRDVNKLQFLFELDEYSMRHRKPDDIPYPFWFTDLCVPTINSPSLHVSCSERSRNPTMGAYMAGKTDTVASRLQYLLKVLR